MHFKQAGGWGKKTQTEQLSMGRTKRDDDTPIDSNEEAATYVAEHFEQPFTSPAGAHSMPSLAIAPVSAREEAHPQRSRVGGAIGSEAISRLKKGKTCADDLVVGEMLVALPYECLAPITNIFETRLLGNIPAKEWEGQLIRTIPNIPNPTFRKDLRGISIVPALCKLYHLALDTLMNEYLPDEKYPEQSICFCKHRQSVKILFTIQQCIEKSTTSTISPGS